jgi:transcription elongation factor Elf1
MMWAGEKIMEKIKNAYTTKVTCGACGKASDFTVHQLMDTLQDPQAANHILDGSAFYFRCPHCGEMTALSYTCLFHDGSKKLLYALADKDEDAKRFEQLFSGEKEDGFPDAVQAWINTCSCRIVRSVPDLQEKIILAYLGLDDRVMEMCKYIATGILLSSKRFDNIVHTWFNTDGDKWELVVDDGKEDLAYAEMPKQMYEDMEKQMPDLKNDKSFVVDEAWAARHAGKLS